MTEFVTQGKYLRSTFFIAGWVAVAEECRAATRAAASMELLHCFALLQDDVMDESPLRRGAPAAHMAFAEWHRGQGLAGSPQRFGESAAILAADLCLVWAEQMLRESGMDLAAIARALPRYDRLRSELAVGQFRDLVNESRRHPSLRDVLSVARAKSGNYTVRRPLELGADLAGGPASLLNALGRYGTAVGEAFQLRDDLLGLFGDQDVTGKPVGEDVLARKATCVIVLARDYATPAARRELDRLDALDELGPQDVSNYLQIIDQTGARQRAEALIAQRVARALSAIRKVDMPAVARDRLTYLARRCADRAS